ncbi:MAG: hypothetical protein HQM10_12235 [Candidatus Riflebacteria bacterium]|nr:hypothetical protein [Candidatus Riflebacteria bacterium]
MLFTCSFLKLFRAVGFPDFQIVHALSAQLSWTHFRSIIYLKTALQRDFYAEKQLRKIKSTSQK